MRREINFRVWCEFEINGKHFQEMHPDAGWFLLSQVGQIMSHGPMGDFDPNAAQKYTKLIPMLATGLRDKTGAPIYEHDVVRDSQGIGVVRWKAPGFIVCDRDCNEFWIGAGLAYPPDQNRLSDTEVIGNIYQNPELLGE